MRAVRTGVAILAAFVAACAASTEPQLVSLPQSGLRPVARLEHISDYRTAAATVVWIGERHLGFPSFPVTFHFYPNERAFEHALVDSGYDAALARSTARTMVAVGGHRGVLLNELRLSNFEWPDRVALLAHEMTHSLQYELGGGRRGTSDQWLREGFADWMSLRVLERISDINIAGVRRARQSDVRAAGRANVPRLSELVTFRQWVRAGERRGAVIYAVAFLAVELLLERHGVPAFIEYFQRFASSRDRLANFHAAFGEDLESFERTAAARISPR